MFKNFTNPPPLCLKYCHFFGNSPPFQKILNSLNGMLSSIIIEI
jgi:hypothetical protein